MAEATSAREVPRVDGGLLPEHLAPVLAWPNRTGPAAISYIAGAVKKFVLVVGTPTIDTAKGETYPYGEMGPTLDTWVAEADELTGPYRLVQYLSKFGEPPHQSL